jgi:hypothetical protein
MRIRRSLATAAVLVAATAPLSACGGSGGSGSSASATASGSAGSSASSSASSSAGSTGAASDTGGPLSKAEFVQAITQGQIKAGSAHVAMAMTGALAMTAQGDVSYKQSTPEMRMTMSMQQLGGRAIEMRLVGGIVYMHIPQLVPAGKFVEIDPHDTSNPLSKGFGSITQQMDPLASAKAMRSSVRTVRYVGAEKIQGEPADHYEVGVDTAAMTKASGSKAAPGMPRTLTYDMWLDSKDLLRRMRFGLSGMRMTMTMSRWGEPVTVQAPPARTLVDPSTLGGAAAG